MIENQLSTKFKGIYLGFSKVYTINDSGCLTACIARVVKKPLLEVHQALKDGGCFFNECLLDLTKVPKVYPQLTYTGKFAYDNNTALEAIKRNGIVIAEVDYNPIMNGTQQHFVCMVGDGNIEDPLGGKLKPVTTYKTYLTLRVFEIKPLPVKETMTEEEKRILKVVSENKLTEGNIRQLIDWIKDDVMGGKDKQIQTLTNKVAEMEGKIAQITVSLNELKLNYQEKEKMEYKQQKVVEAANVTIEQQKATIDDLDRLAKDNRNLYDKKNDAYNELLKSTDEKVNQAIEDALKDYDAMSGWDHLLFGFRLLIQKQK